MEELRINNQDHILLLFRLATPVRRFLAGAIDCLIQTVLIVLLLFSMLGGTYVIPISILLIFGVYWLYPFAFELFCLGKTPGKYAMDIAVVGEDGRAPNWRQCLIRSLLRLVDGQPGITFAVAGLSMHIDGKGRRLGDLLAGTYVVVQEGRTANRSGALWFSQVNQGHSQQALRLPRGKLSPQILVLIDQFLQRRDNLEAEQRQRIAWNLAQKIAPLTGWAPAEIRVDRAEDLLEWVMERLMGRSTEAEGKIEDWKDLEKRLLRARKSLHSIGAEELEKLIVDYRNLLTGLARARAFQGDEDTLAYLNHLAVLGNQVLYPSDKDQGYSFWDLFWAFPRAVRRNSRAVLLSTLLFFVPAGIAYIGVQASPQVGFDLVAPGFYDFSPTHDGHLHEIPSLARPLTASGIIANNIQVSFAGFASGVTAGIGTVYVLVSNGLHLGAVAGWMELKGSAYALWGWVMPHGVTEILAIILSCAAGLVIADSILMPGRRSRLAALREASMEALIIELGVVGMLGIAGLIEGFVSPSSIEYPIRIAIVVASVLTWGLYFLHPQTSSDKSK